MGNSRSSGRAHRAPPQTGGTRQTNTTASRSTRNTTASGSSGASNPLRCPRCRRLLQPPAGHERFLCPCGQLLMAPVQQPVQQVNHVRCPNCSTTLAPPPGAPIFRCPCGTHLRAPNVFQAERSQARLDISGGDTHSQEDILRSETASQSQVVASLMHMRGEQQWMRKATDDGKALTWLNMESDEDERRKMMKEEKCLSELDANVDKLDTKGLYEKLESMFIDTDDCETKEDLRDKLKACPEILKKLSVRELKERLRNLTVPSNNVLEKSELVSRLITAVWYPGLYYNGHVRDIRPDNTLDWIPASEFRLSTQVQPIPLDAKMLEHMSAQPFMAKHKWFKEQMAAMKIKWEDGRVQLKIRRSELLRDSFTNLNKLEAKDLRRYWRFEFIGEEGIDAGGLAREWFQLVTDQCFNVDFGLFEYSGVDNICYQINPSSGIANELHLKYFYFLGRVMGKAMFEGHVIAAHMARPLYKHLLGFPITQDDIEFVDSQVYKSMKDIREIDDVEYLYLDFTTAVRVFGETQTVELMEDGANTEVTNENRDTYLHLLIKYILFDRISPQLAMILKGFSEIIPLNVLSIFDYQELELLMCGLPNINVDDWRQNTTYRGAYANKGLSHQVVAWFWKTMEEFTEEQRARFLQFATGTSRVPVQGFGALQGNDGNIKLFTIDSVQMNVSVFPKAHTCFNRIELPLYESKAQLRKFILQAVQLESVGFNQE